MKIKCRQKDLAFALNLVNRAVSPNTTLPVLNNILIKAQGKHLYFSATNLEVAMTYFIEVEVLNEGAVTIPAKLITNYVALLNDEEVEIKLEDRLNLSLKTPLSHTKIKGIDPQEFPVIPEVEKGVSFVLNSSALAEAIQTTAFAASINVSRPVLTGILVKGEKSELVMVATDSYRLSEKILFLKKPLPEPLEYIIPAKTVLELGKILVLFGEEEVGVQITRNQVLFSIGNLRIISRLIEGIFPDYKKIIPASSKTTIKVGVQDFVIEVKKVSLFVQETNHNIKVSVTNNGKLVISTDETQIGEGTAEVDVSIEGENNKVALNAQYLLDALAHLEDSDLILKIDNKLAPVTMSPAKRDSGYTHIIMPLKL